MRMPGNIWALSFSPDASRLAVVCSRQHAAMLRVWAWQYDTPGALLLEDQVTGGDCVPNIAWAPDSRHIAWCPGASGRSNPLIQHRSGSRLVLPDAHKKRIRSLTFSPDGRLLASASYDNTVVLRDGETMAPCAPPLRFESRCHTAVFHPRAALLVAGASDGKLRIATCIPELRVLRDIVVDGRVSSLAFSPDGRYLLAAIGGHIHLYRVHITPR